MSVPPPRPFIEAIVREVLQRLIGGDSPPAPAGPPGEPASSAAARRDEPAGRRDPDDVFRSPEAQAARREIVRAARKLWLREYVDGNGGNITCRVSDDYVLSTPTLLSKADVRPSDLTMVDLYGNQVAGTRRRSSEISLHVAIMRAVPEAKAVVHCHPPHATAYAMTDRVPPEWLLAEPEVFIGPIARVPYETPGSDESANAAAAVAPRHNAILLANHGVACWADTVTHAEWYVEILDTYCRTLMLAARIGAPLVSIPPDKLRGLLDLKKGLKRPDVRYTMSDAELAARAARPEAGIAVTPPDPMPPGRDTEAGAGSHLDVLVRAITEQVMARLR